MRLDLVFVTAILLLHTISADFVPFFAHQVAQNTSRAGWCVPGVIPRAIPRAIWKHPDHSG